MNRQETLELLQRFDIQPTRSLGQNFLIDDRVIDRIGITAELTPADLVVEIGPGVGGLTRELARRSGRVIALEIDRHVLPALQSVVGQSDNCLIIQGDALKADLSSLVAGWTGPFKVVANLPYYITTPLIVKLLCELPQCSRLVLMVQKEAVDRILAQPGSKQYGPLAILTACFGQARREFIVPAAAFYPMPGADSCIIRINSDRQLQIADWTAFHKFLEKCFVQRRKTLSNCLRTAGISRDRLSMLPDFLARNGLAENIRAEMLTKDQFVALYHNICK